MFFKRAKKHSLRNCCRGSALHNSRDRADCARGSAFAVKDAARAASKKSMQFAVFAAGGRGYGFSRAGACARSGRLSRARDRWGSVPPDSAGRTRGGAILFRSILFSLPILISSDSEARSVGKHPSLLPLPLLSRPSCCAGKAMGFGDATSAAHFQQRAI